jgi:hypothetical protein
MRHTKMGGHLADTFEVASRQSLLLGVNVFNNDEGHAKRERRISLLPLHANDDEPLDRLIDRDLILLAQPQHRVGCLLDFHPYL